MHRDESDLKIYNRNVQVQTIIVLNISIKMTEAIGLDLIVFEDFNKICRFCCKRSDNMTNIYQNLEESSNNSCVNIIKESDAVVIMLLKIGLSVITRFTDPLVKL